MAAPSQPFPFRERKERGRKSAQKAAAADLPSRPVKRRLKMSGFARSTRRHIPGSDVPFPFSFTIKKHTNNIFTVRNKTRVRREGKGKGKGARQLSPPFYYKKYM